MIFCFVKLSLGRGSFTFDVGGGRATLSSDKEVSSNSPEKGNRLSQVFLPVQDPFRVLLDRLSDTLRRPPLEKIVGS